MRKTIILLLMTAARLVAMAGSSALLVTLTDGTTASYVLSEKPTVTFGDGSLVIRTSDVSTEYLRSDVGSLTFVDAQDGIGQPAEGSTAFGYNDNVVTVEGAALHVYSAGGTLVKSGVRTVSLADQPDGIYIVRYNNQTVKVVKKH